MLLSQVSFSVNPCYYCYFSCFFPPLPSLRIAFLFHLLLFFFCYFIVYLLNVTPPPLCHLALCVCLFTAAPYLYCTTFHPRNFSPPTVLWPNFRQERHHTQTCTYMCTYSASSVSRIFVGFFQHRCLY